MAASTNLLSVADLTSAEVKSLLEVAASLKRGQTSTVLQGKSLALLFEKPSLRTRTSFEMAMRHLGGYALYLSPEEVGLGKRERPSDVARVLGRYVNAIAARTFAHKTIEVLAEHSGIPVINALSDEEHPCQALGDLLTIQEKKGQLPGQRLAYLGDGNNVARSLLLAAAHAGMHFTIASPPGYELPAKTLQQARKLAAQTGSHIEIVTDPHLAADDADIVYTDVWTSMGQEAESAIRRSVFAPYQVDQKLMSRASKGAIFMHPLPAHHGEEVAEGMLEHPQSVVFDQAENRLHIQKAILLRLLS